MASRNEDVAAHPDFRARIRSRPGPELSMTAAVFISYSQKDQKDLEELQTFFEAAAIGHRLDFWSDQRIRAGELWQTKILEALAEANAAILLVSPNFLASQFIRDVELKHILDRSTRDRLTVFPIIARPGPWKLLPWLSRLQVRPKGGKPVWSETRRKREQILNDIVCEIVGEIQATIAETDEKTRTPPPDTEPLRLDTPPPNDDAALAELTEALNESRKWMEDVNFWKRLHDELHQIDTRCCGVFLSHMTGELDDPSTNQILYQAHLDLTEHLETLSRVIASPPQTLAGDRWFIQLESVATALGAALEQADAEGLERATRTLSNIMQREMPRLDSQLNAAARALDVPGLARRLERLRLRSDGDTRVTAHIEAFESKVGDPVSLVETWPRLVEHHARWEEISFTLRMIHDAILMVRPADVREDHVSELRSNWEWLHQSTQELTETEASSKASFEREARKLDDALKQGHLPRVVKYFGAFRSLVIRRFDNTDKELKDRCSVLMQGLSSLAGDNP